MDYVEVCPLVVIEQVKTADLQSAENSDLFSWIAEKAELDCQTAAVLGIADRIRGSSDPQVIADFCGAVATYARFFKPDDLIRIEGAYRRFGYKDDFALPYFLGLRATGVDLRRRLEGKVAENWSFDHPRGDAATWHYYLYLASLGEPGALDALAKKIAETENGNDATNFLQSLSELKAEGVDEILELYANDTRRADGTEAPGMMIKENVAIYLMMREGQ